MMLPPERGADRILADRRIEANGRKLNDFIGMGDMTPVA
jgi:hypothetical protein